MSYEDLERLKNERGKRFQKSKTSYSLGLYIPGNTKTQKISIRHKTGTKSCPKSLPLRDDMKINRKLPILETRVM